MEALRKSATVPHLKFTDELHNAKALYVLTYRDATTDSIIEYGSKGGEREVTELEPFRNVCTIHLT